MDLNNVTINMNMTVPTYQTRYAEYTAHAIDGGQIFLILAGFIFLAFWYIKVSKNKEYYTNWKNPNGREINLYSKVRLLLWLYTATVIILSIIQIIYTNRLT